jgi:hypothetical protein
MDLLNFHVGDDFISVVKDEVYLDLHNNYEFTSYNYNVVAKEFQMLFVKSAEEWAEKDIFNRLEFTFKGVIFLRIQEGDSSEFPNDETCLADIGFSPFDMRHDMESILASNQFKNEYDMIFRFISGQTIKVFANEVLLETY